MASIFFFFFELRGKGTPEQCPPELVMASMQHGIDSFSSNNVFWYQFFEPQKCMPGFFYLELSSLFFLKISGMVGSRYSLDMISKGFTHYALFCKTDTAKHLIWSCF